MEPSSAPSLPAISEHACSGLGFPGATFLFHFRRDPLHVRWFGCAICGHGRWPGKGLPVDAFAVKCTHVKQAEREPSHQPKRTHRGAEPWLSHAPSRTAIPAIHHQYVGTDERPFQHQLPRFLNERFLQPPAVVHCLSVLAGWMAGTVREAVPADAIRLAELLHSGAVRPGKEDPTDLAPYERALREIEHTPGNSVLVAQHGGKVVGVCQLIVSRHLQCRGRLSANLESVHVDEAFRGRGIGGILVEAAIQRAAKEGCDRVQLLSNKVRADAHRFYRAHGFEQSHEGFIRTIEADKSFTS